MELTSEQRAAFREHGFVKLPGIVPQERVRAALRAINASLGEQGIDPAQLTTFRSRSYAPELQSDPAIVDLLMATPLWQAVESAIGKGKVQPVNSGQIALRFPSMQPAHEPHPHLDGMYTPTNGVPKGTIRNFTALVGVMLSDLPDPNAGNLALWPGTHHTFEAWFRERGPESLLEGMPQVPMPAPQQITGKAGDAVLCHYQLAHGISGNASPHIRYAIYFRVFHVDHDNVHWECMTDIWREWDGI